MEFRTIVDIERPQWYIEPAERILCVGSCFADHIGRFFSDNHFPATVNPYGVMYNPASILHTLKKIEDENNNLGYQLVILTLGTNHVYIEKETGEIVDNCQKRPQALFHEVSLTVDQCADNLYQCVSMLLRWNPKMKIILTVSPIRYRKYGYHGSQLSKSTLLLAVDKLLKMESPSSLFYFPAYEIVNDELRDYRFYAPDMLHPSDQAVEYIWQRLVDCCFSDAAKQFLSEWQPLKQALAHRPFDPESETYQLFLRQTQDRLKAFDAKWGHNS
ncbi:MAG: GSCFA domain-containing protein [Prevotella sp.]|nr:GSCFA domain-containing protein [Prevotella sp.]